MKNRKYLGFNDFWFSVIGILILGFIAAYILNNPAELNWIETVITCLFALFFSGFNWLINRSILIHLRKMYPSLTDSAQRISILLLGISVTIVTVDFIGVTLASFLLDSVSYDFQERIRSLVITIVLTAMVMAMYEAIYFFIQLKNSIQEEERAKQAVIQAQLDALRNQAQPHFFFNSLNALRDIIDESPKEDAKNFVDNLSEIYRFILEAGNANLISLRNELKFAKSYMHVQSERFGDNLKFNWNVPDSLLDSMIAPMSLQLLMENAIKHNVVSKAKPLEINVNAIDKYIVIANRIQAKSTQLPSTKLGLKNIEKRYELISDKPVRISNDGHQFSVSLPILVNGNTKDSL